MCVLFYFRFIKSDQNIMMLNLCASLVLAYVVFISSVEQKDNEVHTLILVITIKSAVFAPLENRSIVTLTEFPFTKCFKL